MWEYEVPGDQVAAFTAAYDADGPWAELFARADGFLGTELYRDAAQAGRFLTIDRWRNEQDWRSFLQAFAPAYHSLDAQLEGLAAAEQSLFEGSSYQPSDSATLHSQAAMSSRSCVVASGGRRRS